MVRSRSGPRRKLVVLLLVLVALALMLADRNGAVARTGRELTAYLFQPAQSLSQNAVIRMADRTSGPGEVTATDDERAAAAEALVVRQTQEIADLRNQIASMKEIARGLSRYSLSLIPARIISHSYLGPAGGVSVDAGSKQGVGKGHLVLYRYVNQGKPSGLRAGQAVVDVWGLVGVVDQPGSSVSQVKLVTHPDCRLPARIVHWAPQSGRWVVCAGDGDGGVTVGSDDGQTVRLQLVPKSVDVAVGDYVVTAPMDLPGEPRAGNRAGANVATLTGLPEYLIIGQVAEVTTKPADRTHSIVVRPRADLSRLDQVYVLSVYGGAANAKP